MLERKKRQIETVNKLARGRDRCFRKALLEELEGHPWRFQSTVALRIVRWLFEEKPPQVKHDFCCDVCDPDRESRIIGGDLGLSRLAQ